MPASSRSTALVVCSSLLFSSLCARAEASGVPALTALTPEYAHSALAQDIVLELVIGGGYSNPVQDEFRLFGDGRLEDRRLHVLFANSKAPETRALPFNAKEADELLVELIQDGVVGLTDERLLAAVQEKYPSVKILLGGEDCATTRIRIHLFRRTAPDASWEPSETSLRLECLYAYPRAYPDTPAARAVHDLHARFYALAKEGGQP